MFIVVLCIDDDGIVFIFFILIIIEKKDGIVVDCDDCVSVYDFDCILLFSLIMLYEGMIGLRLKLGLGLLNSVFLFN